MSSVKLHETSLTLKDDFNKITPPDFNENMGRKEILIIVSQHHIVEMSTTVIKCLLPCSKFMSYEGAGGASGLLEEDRYQDGCSDLAH